MTDEYYIKMEKEFNDYCINQKLCSSCRYSKEMTNCAMIYAFEKGIEYERERMEDDCK